jgi:hypothetical protein
MIAANNEDPLPDYQGSQIIREAVPGYTVPYGGIV